MAVHVKKSVATNATKPEAKMEAKPEAKTEAKTEAKKKTFEIDNSGKARLLTDEEVQFIKENIGKKVSIPVFDEMMTGIIVGFFNNKENDFISQTEQNARPLSLPVCVRVRPEKSGTESDDGIEYVDNFTIID